MMSALCHAVLPDRDWLIAQGIFSKVFRHSSKCSRFVWGGGVCRVPVPPGCPGSIHRVKAGIRATRWSQLDHVKSVRFFECNQMKCYNTYYSYWFLAYAPLFAWGNICAVMPTVHLLTSFLVKVPRAPSRPPHVKGLLITPPAIWLSAATKAHPAL